MKKLMIFLRTALFLGGYCLGATQAVPSVDAAKLAALNRFHQKAVQKALKGLVVLNENGQTVSLTAGRNIHQAILFGENYYPMPTDDPRWMRYVVLRDLSNDSVAAGMQYVLTDGRILRCTSAGTNRYEWRIELPSCSDPVVHSGSTEEGGVAGGARAGKDSGSGSGADTDGTRVGGESAANPSRLTRERMIMVPAVPKSPVKNSFWIQRSPRQRFGIGVGAAGLSVAVGSLLYTLIQGLRNKDRRRLIKIALERIFGGSLEPLSKKEEAIISTLYRDLGIGAGGVVLGGLGVVAGSYAYNRKQTAAAAA